MFQIKEMLGSYDSKIEKNLQTGLSKAFDRLLHEILIAKFMTKDLT